MEVEPIYFSSRKLGWRSLTGCAGAREFSIGDVEKSSGLSYTLQMNNPAVSQNPSALKTGHRLRMEPEGTAGGCSCLFLLTPSHTEKGRQIYRGVSAAVCAAECMCTQAFLHLTVMFKWRVWGNFCSHGFCFFLASPCFMSESADSLHFLELSPWREGHILGRGRFAHFLFSSPSLLLYTRGASCSAPTSPVRSIDRLNDLSLWKINRTTLWVLFILIFHGL